MATLYKYFGLLPGQKMKDFYDEARELNKEELEELVALAKIELGE